MHGDDNEPKIGHDDECCHVTIKEAREIVLWARESLIDSLMLLKKGNASAENLEDIRARLARFEMAIAQSIQALSHFRKLEAPLDLQAKGEFNLEDARSEIIDKLSRIAK